MVVGSTCACEGGTENRGMTPDVRAAVYHMVKATKLLEPVGNGITKPYRIQCNDGMSYYVKFAQNPEGKRILANEWIAGRLAQLVGLPIPPMAVVEVDGNFVSTYQSDIEFTIEPGIHFGSRQVQPVMPIMSSRVMRSLTNGHVVPALILFDHWIDNRDRDNNKGNLLVNMKDKKLVVIDHSHVFELGAIWDEHQLRVRIGEPIAPLDLTKHVYRRLVPLVSGNNPFGDALEKFKRVSHEDVTSAVQSAPDEWGCTDVEKSVLVEYLIDRHSMIEAVPDLIRNWLPYWRGGA